MSQWWVFHEDKVDEAIKAWLAEMVPPADFEQAADWEVAVKSFLSSAVVQRLGMRKQ